MATQIDTDRYWLHAAVDHGTNRFLQIRVFPTLNEQFTLKFLRKLRIEHATFPVDVAGYLSAALARLGSQFQETHHGNRNAIERVF